MKQKITRRSFVCGATVAGASLLAIQSLSLGQSTAGASLRLRKSALNLPANDPAFANYARAVAKMHALPAADSRNWRNQAKTHADFCPHSANDFLPWHRHFINQFEKICGDLIGDPKFALPYWDWTNGIGKIPDPFFDLAELDVSHWSDPGVYSSPNWPDIDTIAIRAITKGVGVQNDPQSGGSFTSQKIKNILNETKFVRFTGRLEGTPHNSGHVVVGFPPTGKPGHIGSGLSPLDPLFWLHHCNVDRLWAKWQLAGNSTPDFNLNYNSQFVDTKGNRINVTADGAKDFTSLGYTYEDFGDPRTFLQLAGTIRPTNANDSFLASFISGPLENSTVALGSLIQEKSVEVGVPTSVKVPISNLKNELTGTRKVFSTDFPNLASLPDNVNLSTEMLSGFGRTNEIPRRILAVLKGIKTDFKRPPIVNVFVNCPYLSPTTPWTDTHYADTFSFFGHNGGNHGAGSDSRDVVVDLTNALRDLGLGNAESLKVQFMPVGVRGTEPEGSFSVASIEIIGE